MNRNTKILGIIHLILGGGGMAVCMMAYLVWIRAASDAHSLNTARTLGKMMFMVSLVTLLPSLICGIGLAFNQRWGRVATMCWSVLLLLLIPVGTLLGGYGLWVLLKRASHAYHPHDFEPRKTSPLIGAQHPFSGRTGLLLVMAVVGASMIILLRVGFWMPGQPAPAVIVDPLLIAVVLLFAMVVAMIVVATRSELTRPKHLPLNERLQYEASIAPALPLGSNAICIHLQPIEHAIRAVGIGISQPLGRDVQAYCLVDRVELSFAFGPTIAALYVERHDIDRSYLDPKTALFWCAACNARLWVVHAEAATQQTPWFPASASQAQVGT
jgi:hypothetical protein